VLLICFFRALYVGAEFGFSYGTACLVLIVCSSKIFTRSSVYYQSFYIMAAVAIWAFYLIRPLLLVSNPHHFSYPNLGQVNYDMQVDAVFQIAVFSLCFFCGMKLASLLLPVRTYVNTQKSIFVSSRQLIIFGIFLVFLFKVYLFLGHSSAMSGRSSGFTVIAMLLPFNLVLPTVLVYLLLHKAALSKFDDILLVLLLLLYPILALAEGHKSALLSMLFFLVIVLLIKHGDYRFSMRKLALIGMFLPLIVLSFPLATTLGGSIGKLGLNYQVLINATSILNYVALDSEIWELLLDRITTRLVGYDGLIAAGMEFPKEVTYVFNIENIVKLAIAKLIPGYTVPGISMGKAIGIFFTGHSSDVQHAGALGLFGTLKVIAGSWGGYMLAACFGFLFIGIYVAMVNFNRSKDSSQLIQLLLIAQMVAWISSGNLDNLLQSMIVVIIHLVLFGSMVLFMHYALISKHKKGAHPNVQENRM